jgi:hypothetical protein
MFHRDPISAHYRKLLDSAEAVLRGPLSIQVDIDFWGEPNLTLRSEAMPKIEGVIESRIIYANPCDDEQSSAILRQVSWDAHTARLSVLQDFDADKTPSIVHPVLSVRYVWIDIDWLYEAIRRLEELAIPLKMPKVDPLFRKMYKLGIQRSDRTTIEASWGNSTPGDFQTLSVAWELVWEQMADLLKSGTPVEPEELWQFGSTPIYKQAT